MSLNLNNKSQQGFTLIELMIVVVVVAILAAIALPSYNESVNRGKRSDGKAYLLDLASQQERYFSQNLSYASSVAILGASGESSERHYAGSIAALPSGCTTAGTKCRTYTLTASSSFSDSKCGNLTYTSAGAKGETGTEDTAYCWR